ncbi:hypothetical protein M0R72_18640 [Candidatus Pacearchaeota archaeon]|jgi:hypothetical protein|nr:hypothetical protein [Candidatus Pacearchaeota archaeon]
MTLNPLPGSYVQVLHGAGSESSYSSEAMQEVNLYSARWGFKLRYTIYRITAAAKRIMTDTAAPVIQKKVHGAGDWVTIAASGYTVWYGAGYIEITTPLNSDDTVQCLSGKYLTPTVLLGCAENKLTKKRTFQECTVYGNTKIARKGTIQDWSSSLSCFYGKQCAEISSSGGVANSHVRIIHETGGLAGNGATIDFQDTDAGALSASVTDDDITVILKTSGGSPVSTALEVVAALNNTADFRALGMRAELVSGENGTGIVADSGPYTLAGGLDEIDFDALQGEVVAFRFYGDYISTGDMFVGFGKIESIDWQGGPADLLKAGLSVVGAKYPLHHVIN